VLGYTQFGSGRDIQYGDYKTYRNEDILGRNKVVDFFYKFWDKLERPTRADIKPAQLRSFLDHVVLIDIDSSNGFALHTRLIGTYVASYYGEISGKDINSMNNKSAAQRIYKNCEIIVAEKEPLLTVTPGFDKDKQFLEALALYMPLYGNNGDDIKKIMVCVDITSLVSPDGEDITKKPF
jgi:hypothetical protein